MIIAYDLATSTGFCMGDGSGRPRVGALRGPSTGDDVGEFLAWFRDYFVGTIGDAAVRSRTAGTRLLVVFEAPILMSTQNINVTRKLQGLSGVLEMVCHDAKRVGLPVDVREVNIKTAKKELTGNGNAEKGDMVLAARAAGIEISSGKEGEDEADAFGIWLTAIRYHRSEHLPKWEALIHSKRGSLV